MPDILDITISHPLEREYEAWLAAAIENYFESLKITGAVWAISPLDETTWPADLGVRFPAKLVGLQVKRPTIATPTTSSGKVTFDRIRWTLANPKGQSALVSSMPEIYYCFPCFINRQHRIHALSHCVFWRPNPTPPTLVWYENPRAHAVPSVSHEMRGGRFMERVVGCEIGYPAFNSELVSQFFGRLHSAVRQATEAAEPEPTRHEASAFFTTLFLAIGV